MNHTTRVPSPARRRRATALGAAVLLLSTGLLLPLTGAEAATEVPLGTAENFSVLAYSTATNIGMSTVTGDVGLHPGTSVTGFDDNGDGNAVTLDGTLHVADGVALQAQADLDVAYVNAAGQTPATAIPTELGGSTLTAGVYTAEDQEFGVTGELTLDGEGDPDAVFVFQMGTTLITASDSSINLIGDADLCNVYWQVGSSATLGTDSSFVGTIMADQSITLNTGATVEGRVLARNGAVTMDTNTITNAGCATTSDDDTTDDDTTDDDTGDTTGDTTGDDGDGTPADGTTDGSTTGDGTPAGDTTDDDSSGDDTSGANDNPGDDDDITGQIREVPSGSVAAGGSGISAAGAGQWTLFTVVLVLFMAGSTAAVIARRRVRA